MLQFVENLLLHYPHSPVCTSAWCQLSSPMWLLLQATYAVSGQPHPVVRIITHKAMLMFVILSIYHPVGVGNLDIFFVVL